MQRRWKYWLAAGVTIAVVAIAYRPARQFHRFFLTECAATGPARETELDIHPAPVDLSRFYAELRGSANDFAERELAQVEYHGERWPILLFSPTAMPWRQAVLVVAGIHGNEVSGSLAAVQLLRSRVPDSLALHVLAPANPVGLEQGSRYQALGCDVNRDFASYRTIEARAIRRAIEQVKPRLVISLHEGPQQGIFVIGTRSTPPALLAAVARELAARNYPLARSNNLGMGLQTPGIMLEGAWTTRAKAWLGIYSLGEYTTSVDIPLVTTEAPWTLPEMAQRIEMQQVVVATLLRELAKR